LNQNVWIEYERKIIYYQVLYYLFEKVNQKVNSLIYYWPIFYYLEGFHFLYPNILDSIEWDFSIFVKIVFTKNWKCYLFLTVFDRIFYQGIIYESRMLFFALIPIFYSSFRSLHYYKLMKSFDLLCWDLYSVTPIRYQLNLIRVPIKCLKAVTLKIVCKDFFLFCFLIFIFLCFRSSINCLVFISDFRESNFLIFLSSMEIRQ